MLSTTQVVKARKAIESLYTGTCTIIEYGKFKKANQSIEFKEQVVLENQPCRLSFKTVNNAVSTESGASVLNQVIKVFLEPEIEVKPGSKLTITQNGVTTDYKSSGKPVFYSTHQEITLELFRGWA